jgi:hypothetical protein
MKQEKYKITENIFDLYEKSKDLKDKMFIVENEVSLTYYKVTTKTEELAIAFCNEYECTVYDSYANDEMEDCWGWWKNHFKIINFVDLGQNEDVIDLDDYNFDWCEEPKILIKYMNGFKEK